MSFRAAGRQILQLRAPSHAHVVWLQSCLELMLVCPTSDCVVSKPRVDRGGGIDEPRSLHSAVPLNTSAQIHSQVQSNSLIAKSRFAETQLSNSIGKNLLRPTVCFATYVLLITCASRLLEPVHFFSRTNGYVRRTWI